jgi:hypothetical protein
MFVTLLHLLGVHIFYNWCRESDNFGTLFIGQCYQCIQKLDSFPEPPFAKVADCQTAKT